MDPKDNQNDRNDRSAPPPEGTGPAADSAGREAPDSRDDGSQDDPANARDDPAEPGERETSGEETEEEEESDEGEADGEADLPPPPDDGPLRVLPIRYLPLAEDDARGDRRRSAAPFRQAADDPPGRRVWHWVPLGALVALVATAFTWFAAVSLVPDAQESLETVAESARGVEEDSQRLAIWEELLSGPQADAVRNLVIAMIVSTVAGLFLAGAIVSYVGRAGALEAGLAAATFALMSLLFMGGAIPIMSLVGVAIAFGCGWLGGRLGGWARRRRDARARSEGLR